ncbi:efflux transporter outer membrane subunit [Pseudomonas fulva]|uniref:efflux transporter outer membrane subunit n=1 Tax=Pseudomonas fulva TaxID=47880 RepID=UPI00201E40C1|nr:efflux transporter outer membrane subunit [Pseudomonas fulva]UQY33042.1 efflux transporter outer membrane subunit [Pseudomonas fulva]
MNRRRMILSFMVMTLVGCSTLAPEYQRPQAPIATRWPASVETQASDGGGGEEISWRTLFADPKLREVVQLALENNRDLRVAALNIEKARAQYRIQRAELLPQVDVTGGQTAQRTPASVSYSGIDGVSRSYTLDVGISAYELDLFGRLRSLKDEALQSYLATAETQRATQVSLIAEVADSYLSLAADLDLQRLAHNSLKTRQEAYDLQVELVDVGNSSQVELRQAEGELETARAEALSANNQVALDRNALELLVGAPLPPALVPTSGQLPTMLGVREIPAGMPSALLRNRPDIRSAEHSLIGANANIGAARAAFFPSISLTATAGRASDDLSSLFAGRSWSFVPQISLPIFTAGRLQSELEVSEVQRSIALAEYEQVIQTAFREVSDALADRSVVDEQWEAQRKRTDAAQAAYDLVLLRYEDGVASYLEVLDAQRTLLTARQALIQSDASRQTAVITLYKALGGDWLEEANEIPSLSDPVQRVASISTTLP